MPHKNTALILDHLVQLNSSSIASPPDIALSGQEFALGAPNASRTVAIDVAFGLTPYASIQNPLSEITLSEGLLLTQYGPSIASFAYHPCAEQAFNPSDSIASGNIYLTNCYAFGSIVAERSTVTREDGSQYYSVQLVPYLANGNNQIGGSPLIINKNVDIDTMINWLNQDITPSGTISSGNINIEIIRFVLDIDLYYKSNSVVNKQIKAYTRDLRKIRGWGGFAEETMAQYLTPNMINMYINTQNSTLAYDSALLSLISAWVNLTWYPDFVTFWQSNNLPIDLKNFLYTRLNITIPSSGSSSSG